MFDLSGRTALITGATSGIGREIAVALARAGANVVIHGLERDESAIDAVEACRKAGVDVHFVTGDLAGVGTSAVDAVVDAALTAAPDIDILVSNAGTCIDRSFLDMDYATFLRTMQLNVFAGYFLVQRFARRWVADKTPGRVVLTGSINGRLAERAHTAYDTSKGAVEAMVRSLCVELAPHGIRVNGMAPGLLYTPLTAKALDDERFRNWMELHTPNRTVPGSDACAGTTVYLVSDAAEHVHGQMLFVDGGMSAWQQPDLPPGG